MILCGCMNTTQPGFRAVSCVSTVRTCENCHRKHLFAFPARWSVARQTNGSVRQQELSVASNRPAGLVEIEPERRERTERGPRRPLIASRFVVAGCCGLCGRALCVDDCRNRVTIDANSDGHQLAARAGLLQLKNGDARRATNTSRPTKGKRTKKFFYACLLQVQAVIRYTRLQICVVVVHSYVNENLCAI